MRKYISPNGIGAKEPHFSDMKKEKLVSILEDLSDHENGRWVRS